MSMKYQSHTQQCHHEISVLKKYKHFYKPWGRSVWFVCEFKTRVVFRDSGLIPGRQGVVARNTWHPVTTATTMAYVQRELPPTLLWGRHCTSLYS